MFAWRPRSCRVGHVTQVRPGPPPSMPALSPGDRLGRGASPRRLQGAPATEEGVKPGAAGGPPGTSWLERSEVSGEGGRGGGGRAQTPGFEPRVPQRPDRTCFSVTGINPFSFRLRSSRLGFLSFSSKQSRPQLSVSPISKWEGDRGSVRPPPLASPDRHSHTDRFISEKGLIPGKSLGTLGMTGAGTSEHRMWRAQPVANG